MTLALIAITLIGYGIHIFQYGYYSDDWFFGLRSYFLRGRDFHDALMHLFHPVWDVRPLRFVEPVIKGVLIHYLGLPAAYLFQLLVIALSAVIFFRILIRVDFPPPAAFFVSVVFLLAPLDSTFLWLATLHWRLAMLLTFAAMLLFLRTNSVWGPAGLLLAGFLLNEGAEPLFLLLAVLPASITSRRKKKTLLVFGFASMLYFIWRFVLFPHLLPDPRVQRLLHNGPWRTLKQILINDILGMYIFTVTGTRNMLRAAGQHPGLYFALFPGLSAAGLVTLALRRDIIRRGVDAIKNVPPGRCFLLSGAVILLTYWTGAFMYAGYTPGPDSRMNYPAHAGYAFFILGIVSLVFRLIPGTERAIWRMLPGMIACAALVAGFATAAYQTQTDFVAAWNAQKTILEELIARSAAWPEGHLVVLDYPPEPFASISAFNPHETWRQQAMSQVALPAGTNLVLASDIRKVWITPDGWLEIQHENERIYAPLQRIRMFAWRRHALEETTPAVLLD